MLVTKLVTKLVAVRCTPGELITTAAVSAVAAVFPSIAVESTASSVLVLVVLAPRPVHPDRHRLSIPFFLFERRQGGGAGWARIRARTGRGAGHKFVCMCPAAKTLLHGPLQGPAACGPCFAAWARCRLDPVARTPVARTPLAQAPNAQTRPSHGRPPLLGPRRSDPVAQTLPLGLCRSGLACACACMSATKTLLCGACVVLL